MGTTLPRCENEQFLSTPSARRATGQSFADYTAALFLSTPSARRATCVVYAPPDSADISIHALREEGDKTLFRSSCTASLFLSTPSARRATLLSSLLSAHFGDFYPRPPRGGRHAIYTLLVALGYISIHALREEGDRPLSGVASKVCYFYPRPPRGGRPTQLSDYLITTQFLSTPSARRATWSLRFPPVLLRDFYPRPPRGGRPVSGYTKAQVLKFLSTPSARRATPVPTLEEAKDDKFLSTPSARRATRDRGYGRGDD